jgi:hypothetical protein
MGRRRIANYLRPFSVACLTLSFLTASEHYGQVTFSGLPFPGATVTAARSDKTLTTITDMQGLYSFPDLIFGSRLFASAPRGY